MKINVMTTNGPKPLEGEIVGKVFALTPYLNEPNMWAVTHIETGFKLNNVPFSKARARKLAKAFLASKIPWEKIHSMSDAIKYGHLRTPALKRMQG